MLLNFLLENQEKITFMQSQTGSLDEIKMQCEKISLQKKYDKMFPEFLHSSKEIKIIPHSILDEEYNPLFQRKKLLSMPEEARVYDTISPVFALFTSPLNESWQEIMACKGDMQFAIRTGFYHNEFEIFHSILMGFQGLTIYVTGLDSFQIQYLTEVARDYSFSLFFIVHNKNELNLVLETDAPYIVFSVFQKNNFSINTSILYNLSHFVPKSANLFALASRNILEDKKSLEELGYCGLIVS